jgi:uncharacterized membrane protein YheB (UPF0754 family)
MILKSNSQALEKQTKTLDGNMDAILRQFSSRLDSIKDLAAQSPKILDEVKNFITRNSLVISKNKKGSVDVHFCCSCLKAHITNIARKLNIDENATRILCAVLHCQSGHAGYYMDADKVLKL